MKIKLRARVVEVKLDSEYAKKDNGTTDYNNRVDYYVSSLRIVENTVDVTGHFSVREKLEIGSIHEIYLNTEKQEQVIEAQAFTGGLSPVLSL